LTTFEKKVLPEEKQRTKIYREKDDEETGRKPYRGIDVRDWCEAKNKR
jgi:hypothetical protein